MRKTIPLALALSIGACGGKDGTDPVRAGFIEITGNEAGELEAAHTLQLSATVYDDEGNLLPNVRVTWSSSNDAIATVNSTTGLVTGVGRGTVRIFAAAAGGVNETPINVFILYRSIATGEFNSCDLSSGGVAWCWGENGDNSMVTVSRVPQRFTTSLRFTQLHAGGMNKCAVTADGAGYCWGPNGSGQIGNGSTGVGFREPVAVSGGHVFRTIVTESPVSCGITTANVAYCWGDNLYAIVNGASSVPKVVPGGHAWSMIDVGTTHACGVTTDGNAWCWGSNRYGQHGLGGDISFSEQDKSPIPVQVSGGHTWQTITAGQFYTCGLTTGGAAYCWGFNDYGLGDGASFRSAPAAVSGDLTFDRIDAGRHHTCALTPQNYLWCWGANYAGQLGVDAPATESRVPIAAGNGIAFSEISTSDLEHTCGITASRRAVYCFGRNDYSQLGNNTSTSESARNPTPAVVTGQSPSL